MRFSIYIDSTRVFGGMINNVFDELKNFLEKEGIKFNSNDYLIICNTDINKITVTFYSFLKEKVRSCYNESPSDYSDFRGWEELKLDNIIYRLYSGTEERKMLLYHFIFYKALLKSVGVYDIKIVLGDNIEEAGCGNSELYL
jgi:hypothetical protein